ncbi:alkylmercury lyase [Rhodococcus sp. NPDC056960]|uniref:alkylmercury lyase n=1 Tax=Rhodococcus sp. NPDC056960 TaxID=3345982 RepID=UPI00363E620E
MQIELLSVPGCPNVAVVRALLYDCLEELGLGTDITEHVGDCTSPTVLLDGVDVTGRAPGCGASCRIDLPTRADLRVALAAGRRD